MALSDAGPLIRKLTEGGSLSADEAEEAFSLVEAEDEESYFYFTLLAALHTKGETADELLGFCRANRRFVPEFDLGADAERVIDISGTGGDRLKTANVSTAAAFIIASHGLPVVKQAFLSVTGVTGSADLLQALGTDPLGMSREGPDRLRDVFNQTGMLVYHANSMASPATRKGYFNFWLQRVPETGLTFTTAYHLAANVYSPVPMKRRVYGVFSPRYLPTLAELFERLGYRRALVVHGLDGLDEVSNVGETRVSELTDGTVREYSITPLDLGLSTSRPDEVRGSSKEENIRDFLRVLYGAERGAKRDLILANAAAGLYATETVKTLKEGVGLAAALVDEGKAGRQLDEYIKACGDVGTLEEAKVSSL